MTHWSKHHESGDIHLVTDPKYFNSRIGNCWMKGRLLMDDLILCVGHSGDGFHSWVVINIIGNGIEIYKESKFGSYGYNLGLIIHSREVLQHYMDNKFFRFKKDDPDELEKCMRERIKTMMVKQVIDS